MSATRGGALFVSPHLDDAVFACGDRLAASAAPVVATIFAGFAPEDGTVTRWDAECGFASGDDVIALRRAEDRAALDILGATAVWLDFRDDQYGEPRSTQDITGELARLLDALRPTQVHLPLGLFHRDHRRASDAALALASSHATWIVYADAIYRRIADAVDERVAELEAAGYVLMPMAVTATTASARKREAVRCYQSQHRALRTRRAHDDIFEPERFWTLHRGADTR